MVGKGEIACYKQFLLLERQNAALCGNGIPEEILLFGSALICHLQVLSIWTGLKFCRLVKKS